jgi:hypothetical protein
MDDYIQQQIPYIISDKTNTVHEYDSELAIRAMMLSVELPRSGAGTYAGTTAVNRIYGMLRLPRVYLQ